MKDGCDQVRNRNVHRTFPALCSPFIGTESANDGACVTGPKAYINRTSLPSLILCFCVE